MELIIDEVEITQDENGRYSLNDLHKASGSLDKHKPSNFKRTYNLDEFIRILKLDNPSFEPIQRIAGRYGGTWVCRELVYKYAMWVSPAFELKVIRTFDAISRQVEAPETMKALNALSNKIENDKLLASMCGVELAKYKKVKKKNQDNWVAGVNKVQMSLGIGQ